MPATNFELQYLSPREFSAFKLPEVERWFAVIRTTGRFSVGDFERKSKKARNLKERFLSNQSHADVDQLEWVTHWSGTKGARSALLLSWPAGRRFSSLPSVAAR